MSLLVANLHYVRDIFETIEIYLNTRSRATHDQADLVRELANGRHRAQVENVVTSSVTKHGS